MLRCALFPKRYEGIYKKRASDMRAGEIAYELPSANLQPCVLEGTEQPLSLQNRPGMLSLLLPGNKRNDIVSVRNRCRDLHQRPSNLSYPALWACR